MEDIAFLDILPMLLGGLILFLYAIRRLSISLQNLFTHQAERLIARYTSNIYRSILIGVGVTILLDSSSAVIIIIIIFINSGSISFRQAMGIIMGANIGTTFSSQLIAFDINKYAVIPLFIGFFIWLLTKPSKLNKFGELVLYFGLLFFGFYLMETSVDTFRNSQLITQWILQISHPPKLAILGGVITLIIQSSSATMGILIVMVKKGLIDLPAGMAIMLGAELGTCSDSLVAVVGGKRDAIRAGVFQTLFNLVPIILGLLFFEHFVALVKWISTFATTHRQLANAHLFFSVISVLIFLPFVNLTFRLINWVIPDKRVTVGSE